MKSASLRNIVADLKNLVVLGDAAASEQVQRNILRVFVSGADTHAERNYLMREIYPELQLFCKQNGLEFDAVDLQWGFCSKDSSDPDIPEICLAELERCIRDSIIGPCFIFLSSNQYGWQPLPRVIAADEFHAILSGVTDEESRHLVLNWYKEDENVVPSEYVLQMQNNINNNEEPTASQTCIANKLQLCRTLTDSALMSPSLTMEQKAKWNRSITEEEVRQAMAILGSRFANNCLMFVRNISHESINDDQSADIGDHSYDSQTRIDLLRDLVEETKAHEERYSVSWTNGEISEDTHKEYVHHFGNKVKELMTDRVEKSISYISLTDDLTDEVATHMRLFSDRSKQFYGRSTIVQQGLRYFKEIKNKKVFVVHGATGTGKTSFMAKLALEAFQHFTEHDNMPPMMVCRSCGVTPESSKPFSLVKSMCRQIAFATGRKISKLSHDYEKLVTTFHEYLRIGVSNRKVIVFVDSLDSLQDKEKRKSCMSWLPEDLPPNVYIVVSSLSSQKGCFESLHKTSIPDRNYLEIKALSYDDSLLIFGSLLEHSGRLLTPKQLDFVLDVVTDNSKELPTALRLRLLFDIAVQATSYDNLEDVPVTISDLFNSILNNLESKHGKILVSATLSFLCISEHGLSDYDLLNLLSTMHDVVDHVIQSYEAPLRRVPPMIFARLRRGLRGIIVEGSAYSKPVLSWRHKVFKELAEERYLNDQRAHFVDRLRQYFGGELTLDNQFKGRNIPEQPLYWQNTGRNEVHYNIQKLSELPKLSVKGTNPLLVEGCLCNMEFLAAKLQAGLGADLLNDYKFALEHVKSARLLDYYKFISSQIHVLTEWPHLIFQQAINSSRSSHVSDEMSLFIQKMPLPWISALENKCLLQHMNKPSQAQPCFMTLKGRKQRLNMLKFWNEKFLITLCSDNQINIWDFVLGEMKKVISIPVDVSFFALLPSVASSIQSETDPTFVDIACACENGDVYLWRVTAKDTLSAVLLSRWNAHTVSVKGRPISVSYADDGSHLLATGMSDDSGLSEVKLWDLSPLSPKNYQHPRAVTYKSSRELNIYGLHSKIVSVHFVLACQYLLVSSFGENMDTWISLCPMPDLQPKLLIRRSEFAFPYIDVLNCSFDVSFLSISLMNGAADSTEAAVVKLERLGNGDIRAGLFRIPYGAACRFLGGWKELIAVTKEKLSIFSLENEAIGSDLPQSRKDVIEWETSPCIETNEVSTVIIHDIQNNNKYDLPAIGPSNASRFDIILGSSETIGIGSTNDVIKLLDVNLLRKQGQLHVHDSRINVCLTMPNGDGTVTCSGGLFPTTQVWNSQTGKVLKTYRNQGCIFAAYSQDLTQVLYIRDYIGNDHRHKTYLYVVDSGTFSKEMRLSGFPDASSSTKIRLPPYGEIEDACFSSDNMYVCIHYYTEGNVCVISLSREICTQIPVRSDPAARCLQMASKMSLFKPAFFLTEKKSLLVWNHPKDDNRKSRTLSKTVWKLEDGCILQGIFSADSCWVTTLCKFVRCVSEDTLKTKARSYKSDFNVEQLFYFSRVCALPDASMVATATDNGELQLRDFETFNVLCKTLAHSQQISKINVTPDSQRLITCSYDGWLRVWNVSNLGKIGEYHNGEAITSCDIIQRSDGTLFINFADVEGQFYVLRVTTYVQ